jgi:fatty acid desaturase
MAAYANDWSSPSPVASVASDFPVADPRQEMARRLPAALQGFLTWLTAMPAPGEAAGRTTAVRHLVAAFAWILAGLALGAAAFAGLSFGLALLPLALLFVSCGLGLFQVVIFHHCSHGTVFRTRERNRQVGRMISAILLFKHFDLYQREHMLHHSAKKLLTAEDEFAQFVFDMCGLEAGLSKAELWRRIAVNVASPLFHGRFLWRRIRASLGSHDRSHNLLGITVWAAALAVATAAGILLPFLVLWVLPVTVLLQIATIFRILCEHRFPDARLIEARDKLFVCLATTGVFPGTMPPPADDPLALRIGGWLGWWTEMLTVQLFVRLFVLVGDAPCHDFHHRRPASKRWTSYAHARQSDRLNGCPSFPVNYCDSWGLLRAIDQNLATLAAADKVVLGRGTSPASALDDALGGELDRHGGAELRLAA